MRIGRRGFLGISGAAALAGFFQRCASPPEERTMAQRAAAGAVTPQGAEAMYGLIGQMSAVPGQRDALIAILLEGVSGMPGCLSYVVAKDPRDAGAIWITEVWDSETSHKASLSLPSVREAIARGRPLIASFGDSTITEPVGGHGLAARSHTG